MRRETPISLQIHRGSSPTVQETFIDERSFHGVSLCPPKMGRETSSMRRAFQRRALRPELPVECGLRLSDCPGICPSGQVLPSAVRDDECDVGP